MLKVPVVAAGASGEGVICCFAWVVLGELVVFVALPQNKIDAFQKSKSARTHISDQYDASMQYLINSNNKNDDYECVFYHFIYLYICLFIAFLVILFIYLYMYLFVDSFVYCISSTCLCQRTENCARKTNVFENVLVHY